jgi:hypothetical protein
MRSLVSPCEALCELASLCAPVLCAYLHPSCRHIIAFLHPRVHVCVCVCVCACVSVCARALLRRCAHVVVHVREDRDDRGVRVGWGGAGVPSRVAHAVRCEEDERSHLQGADD